MCWTGFLGAFLLYSFILKPILWINKFKKNIRNKEEYAIITSFNLVAINYVICSVYWSLIADTIMWFIIGIHCSYIMIVKNKIYQIKIRNNI